MTPAFQNNSARQATLLTVSGAPLLAARTSTKNSNNSMAAMTEARLRKHADYQRVYKSSRKHFSPSMSYFFSLRNGDALAQPGPRVGLTAGRVMGKAVDRNRIKRRMRAAVSLHVSQLNLSVDVVLHPRRSVLTVEFSKLSAEVCRIFTIIQKTLDSSTIETIEKTEKA